MAMNRTPEPNSVCSNPSTTTYQLIQIMTLVQADSPFQDLENPHGENGGK